MQIKLEDDQIKQLVQEGILAQLTGGQREAIISQALSELLAPRKNSYGQVVAESPLQQAFEIAAANVAREVAKELIEEDPSLRARIKEQVAAGVGKLVDGENGYSPFSEGIYSVINEALRSR